jgi:hypothetical protein
VINIMLVKNPIGISAHLERLDSHNLCPSLTHKSAPSRYNPVIGSHPTGNNTINRPP